MMTPEVAQNLATIVSGFKEMEKREDDCVSFMCKEVVEVIKRLDYLSSTIERVEPLRGSINTATAFLNSLYFERDQLLARFESYVSTYLAEISRPNWKLQNSNYPHIEV